MATARTIIKESNLVLGSVIRKDLEPRSDGRPCPHQHLRLGSHLSIVCYQGVAMLCTTRVIHRMSSEYVAYPMDWCDIHQCPRASLRDWETVLHVTPTSRPYTPHRAERRNPLPLLDVSCSKETIFVGQQSARSHLSRTEL